MKIVILDKEESQKIGGIEVFSKRLSDYLTSRNHQVYILRFAKKNIRQKNIYRLPYYLAEPRSFIFLPSEKTLQIIKKFLQKIKPDIIYTCVGLSPLDFFLPSLTHDLGIPLSAILHADFNYSLSAYQILAKSVFLAYLPFCKQLDLLHVFSDKLAQFYISKGVEKKRVLTLANGVDTKFYSPGKSDLSKKYDFTKGILFLGRLTLQKNPEVLIESFLKINPDLKTKLILVGFGEKFKELREKYKDKRIIFTGCVENETYKLEIIRSCQIFVLPSRIEGMPLALLEAMSCGLCCITSDAGANSELVSKTGIVIPTSSLKQQLPLALKIFIEHPDFARKLGQKARKRAVNFYSQDKIFKKLESRLQQTIRQYQKKDRPRTTSFNISKQLDKIWHLAKKMGISVNNRSK